MAKGSFGENLRREREMRGVGLEEIATATRISTRFLQALENEQWDRLPGGVFNRGFIRAVARFLGLDEEALIAEYAQVTGDPPEVAVWVDAPTKRDRPLLRPVLVILLLATMLAGAWVAWQEWAPMAKAMYTRWLRGEVPARLPSAPPARRVHAPEPEWLELKIEAGKTTSVTIIADGRTSFEGRMAEKESRRFQAKDKFEIAASDSHAVLLELNGQTLPPLGLPGEPGKVTLTRKDLKKTQGGQN
jgi:transcriptional regulator with XRE-family HTH domain